MQRCKINNLAALQMPVIIFRASAVLPAEYSFLQPNSDNVIVTAVRKAEDNDALIVRFYEWAGKRGDVAIQLPTGATSASETDLMEKPLANLPVSNGGVKVPTKPYEIKTIEVRFSDMSGVAEDRK